jgi:hypothetical protein
LTEIEQLSSKINIAQLRIKEAQARLAPTPARRTVLAGPQGDRIFTAEEQEAVQKKLAAEKSPQYQHLQMLSQRLALETRYQLLFQKLHLEPNVQEKFELLLLQQAHLPEDISRVMEAAIENQQLGQFDVPAVTREAIRASESELAAQIRSVVGEANYAAVKAYETNISQNLLISQLRQNLSENATPLSNQQVEAMLDILTSQSALPPFSGNIMVPIPSVESAPIKAAGYQFLPLKQGDVYIAPSGAIISNSPLTDDTITALSHVLNLDQMATLQRLREIQDAEHNMAIHFRQG